MKESDHTCPQITWRVIPMNSDTPPHMETSIYLSEELSDVPHGLWIDSCRRHFHMPSYWDDDMDADLRISADGRGISWVFKRHFPWSRDADDLKWTEEFCMLWALGEYLLYPTLMQGHLWLVADVRFPQQPSVEEISSLVLLCHEEDFLITYHMAQMFKDRMSPKSAVSEAARDLERYRAEALGSLPLERVLLSPSLRWPAAETT